MLGGLLTPRETEIIHHLLLQRGISDYVIVEANPEGRDLVGCAYDSEVELLCATIETPLARYSFWLDWEAGQYVLKYWHAETPDQVPMMT